MTTPNPAGPRRARPGASVLLTLAAIAVAFAAADTYVVVLALPDMMTTARLPITDLQRAAPIVSGFLLGYVAMLPLIGRIADLRGRPPVLVACLVVFSVGSLLTIFAYDLGSLVAGRFVQGVGAGGLVPVTLAMVADLYPVERRGVPLGLVSAVQEIGSVLGPLFGALVLAIAPWQGIFAINLVVGALLAVLIATSARRHALLAPDTIPRGPRVDVVGLALLGVALAAAYLTVVRPAAIMRDLVWGAIFVPYVGSSRWVTPIGLIALGALVALAAWCWLAPLLIPRLVGRPLVDLRGWGGALRDVDLLGAVLLAVALAGVILAFATADPAVAVFAPSGKWYLLAGALGFVLLLAHLRRAENPLVPSMALAARPAWGALVVSFLIGAALIAALVDIPLFARTTVYPDSQLSAALVLVRFLLALPIGAVLGGTLLRRLTPGTITAAGMLFAAGGFAWMAQWGATSLSSPLASVPLLLGGFGFGLALAPVNAALLAASPPATHGVASAMVVVARMVGMLVGISALTTLGLRRFYSLPESTAPLERAIAQEHTVFLGAAGCAVLAGLAALLLFRGAGTADLDPAEALRAGG